MPVLVHSYNTKTFTLKLKVCNLNIDPCQSLGIGKVLFVRERRRIQNTYMYAIFLTTFHFAHSMSSLTFENGNDVCSSKIVVNTFVSLPRV